MKIKSYAFEHGKTIPNQYTCEGANETLPFDILEAPENTKSFVFIIDDPDAPSGLFTHWLVFNVPSDINLIRHNTDLKANFGTNDFGQLNYGGPCPPSGEHRYYIKVYALDDMLNLSDGSTRDDIEEAMSDKIIEKAELMGVFLRAEI